ncbi:MAG: ABC transporter substrate-binding protein [Ottowia sp.]|nr:ABC transporter substrate-binding protein [Ottowia sp.]
MKTLHSATRRFVLALGAAALLAPAWSLAADETPDGMVQRLSTELLDTIKGDAGLQGGDLPRLMQLVDSRIMPHVNFTRMTASATGPAWRKASADQRQQLQQEFKTLLVRTYAGALKQVGDKRIDMLPFRGNAADKEVLVRTLIRGKGEPIQLDYRLERADDGAWRIYDMNVLGVWLVGNYKTQFKQQIDKGGIDALIQSLVERNRSNAAAQ